MADDRVAAADVRVLLDALGVQSDHVGDALAFEELVRAVRQSDRVVALEVRSLDVGLDALTAILRDYGHDASYECEAGAMRALVSCAGKSTIVAADDGLAPVASELSRLVYGRVEFRRVGEHALVGLSSDMWRKLDRAIPQLVRRMFARLTAK